MPEDIDTISPEELFSQQFKRQLAPTEVPSSQIDEVAADAATPVAVSGDPVNTDAPKELDQAKVVGDQSNTPVEAVDTDGNPLETPADAPSPAEAVAKVEAGEPEEPWDVELLKQEIPDSPVVEWRAVHEVKEEVDEIDDGRKDGVAGVNGEMEDTDMEEYKLITEKEFQAQLKELMMPTLMKFFRPELLNRFDELVFFTPLRKKELIQIVDIMLRETREMLGEKDMQLKLTDAAREFLAEKGYNPAFGARPLRRAIQEYLEDPLSDMLIQGGFVGGDIIYADAVAGKLEFRKDIGNGKVEDPFAELDEKPATDSQAQANTATNATNETDETENIIDPFADKNEPQQNPNAPAPTNNNPQSPFAQAAPQAGQQGYVFPADAEEANQHPISEAQPSGDNMSPQSDGEKKRSFLDKMFVKPKADADPATTGARDSRGEGGIRFENGKIVEE